jgi:hypothetical protein
MAFRSSIDAFMYALHEVAGNGHQAEVLYSIGYMRNGLRHCSVQVSRDGIGYGIDAYGEEADQLYEVAKKHSGRMILAA